MGDEPVYNMIHICFLNTKGRGREGKKRKKEEERERGRGGEGKGAEDLVSWGRGTSCYVTPGFQIQAAQGGC